MTPITKTCTGCKQEMPLDSFYNSKHGFLGKTSRCKECEKKRLYAWRKKNATSDNRAG